MECIALLEAFKIALNHCDKNMTIFTDSLNVLHSLKSTNIQIGNNLYIYEMKKLYNEFITKKSENVSMHLYWIPSHQSIHGNEQADALAKSITNSRLSYSVKSFTYFVRSLLLKYLIAISIKSFG